MKSNKDFGRAASEDSLRRASKLDPMRRSGKERHHLYKAIVSDDQDDLDDDYYALSRKRESVLDYMDDPQDED